MDGVSAPLALLSLGGFPLPLLALLAVALSWDFVAARLSLVYPSAILGFGKESIMSSISCMVVLFILQKDFSVRWYLVHLLPKVQLQPLVANLRQSARLLP